MRHHTNPTPGDTVEAPVNSRHRGNARIARSKGGLSGFLLLLLGVWAGAIPFVGPIFDFGYSPDSSWTWTSARFWYEVLPAGVTVVGALLLIVSANRAVAMLGAWAAAAAGAWLVVGPVLSPQLGRGSLGSPIDTGWVGTLESIALFFGVGAVILFLASTAIGRLSVKGVRDVRAAERKAEKDTYADTTAPASDGVVRARDPRDADAFESTATDSTATATRAETRVADRHDPMVKSTDGTTRDAVASDDTRDALDVTDGRYTRDVREDGRVAAEGRRPS